MDLCANWNPGVWLLRNKARTISIGAIQSLLKRFKAPVQRWVQSGIRPWGCSEMCRLFKTIITCRWRWRQGRNLSDFAMWACTDWKATSSPFPTFFPFLLFIPSVALIFETSWTNTICFRSRAFTRNMTLMRYWERSPCLKYSAQIHVVTGRTSCNQHQPALVLAVGLPKSSADCSDIN